MQKSLRVTDPAKDEEWMKETERVFYRLHCTSRKQLEFIVSLLKSHDFTLWDPLEKVVVSHRLLNYEDSKKEFTDEYMPLVYQDHKKVDFYNLKQGNLTMADYEL
ncbi:hypothetical protein M5689_007094 [Euphorbia peplus]|nr:hypothetical protein M5689_007094 [Euphorbia peplus]